MRDIKFRVWYKEKKEMREVAMLRWENGELVRIAAYWPTTRDNGWTDYNPKDNKFVLMQFTGLKDRNGKEIYEGDIVECEQMQGAGKFKGIVHFGVEERGYSDHLLYDARVYLDTRPFDEIKGLGGQFCCFHYNPEIIGNIYENPDLLSSSKK